MRRLKLQRADTDTTRMHYTYVLAFVTLAGLFSLLLIETPGITGGEKLAFVSAATVIVLNFAFKREESTGQARASERAAKQGAEMAATQATVTS